MKRIFICLMFILPVMLLPFAANSQAVPNHTDPRLAGLDTAFERILKDWNCAGFSVAVVEKDQLIYARGFGYADHEKRRRVTPNTLFAAGSCTKSFTCALLGILRDEGKLDFEKPVRDYLPELRFYNDAMNSTIRVKDLMTHSTGLPRHDMAWAFFKTRSKDTLLQRIQYLEPNYGVREKWQYNNFMFLVQGMLAEKISGKSYSENLWNKILTPAGITNLNFSVDSMKVQPDFSYGYTVDESGALKKLEYTNLDVMQSVGAINTSAVEMAKWLMLWTNGGKLNGRHVLSPAYMQEAMTTQIAVGSGLPSKNNREIYFDNYGLGWFLSSYRGHYRVEHGGNITGFSSNNTFYPADSIGIVILCNQDVSNKQVLSSVRNLIADRMLKLPYRDWQSFYYSFKNKSMAAPSPAAKKGISKPAHPLESYEGVYSNKGYGSFEVILRNDSLMALVQQDAYWLRPSQYDAFEWIAMTDTGKQEESSAGMSVVFSGNEVGGIAGAAMNLEPELNKPVQFERTVKAKLLSNDALQQYTGQFDLGPLKVNVVIKNNQFLYLQVPNQPDYELVAEGNEKFSLKDHSEISVTFIKNEKAAYNELILVQPGVRLTGRRINK